MTIFQAVHDAALEARLALLRLLAGAHQTLTPLSKGAAAILRAAVNFDNLNVRFCEHSAASGAFTRAPRAWMGLEGFFFGGIALRQGLVAKIKPLRGGDDEDAYDDDDATFLRRRREFGGVFITRRLGKMRRSEEERGAAW